MWAIARPMPLEAPVMRAARSDIRSAVSNQAMGPFAVCLVVLALLVPLAFLTGGEEEPDIPDMAPVATIADRVEAIRGLRFKTLPEVERVSPEEATEEGLAE